MLADRHLLATTGAEDDYTFSQQLISYKLAFWVCELVANASQEIVAGSDAAKTSCHENFVALLSGIPKPT